MVPCSSLWLIIFINSRLQNSVSFAAAKQFFGLTPCKTAVSVRKLLQIPQFCKSLSRKEITAETTALLANSIVYLRFFPLVLAGTCVKAWWTRASRLDGHTRQALADMRVKAWRTYASRLDGHTRKALVCLVVQSSQKLIKNMTPLMKS